MSSRLDGEGPLFKQFQREIVQKIVSGELAPGDRLEPEAELVKIYGLSRQTIGKALTGLADQGVLERNKRAGTTVARGFREQFAMPARDISQEVMERGGIYEYEILDITVHTNGEGRLHWTDLPAGTRFVQVEALHCADNIAAQFERRLINLDALPEAEDQTFTDAPPGQWMLRNAKWNWIRKRIYAANTTPRLAGLLQVPVGAAYIVLERRLFRGEQAVSMVYLCHPGERFALDGDFGLAASEHPKEILGIPQHS
jgi:GntR family histidine utilization transcriptional repressor